MNNVTTKFGFFKHGNNKFARYVVEGVTYNVHDDNLISHEQGDIVLAQLIDHEVSYDVYMAIELTFQEDFAIKNELSKLTEKTNDQADTSVLNEVKLSVSRVLLKAEKQREAEKRPIIDAGNEIQRKWKDSIKPFETLKAQVDSILLQRAKAFSDKLDDALTINERSALSSINTKSVAVFKVEDLMLAVKHIADTPAYYEVLEQVVLKAAKANHKMGFKVPGVAYSEELSI